MTTSSPERTTPRFSPSLAGWSLGAFILGTVLGLLGRYLDLQGMQILANVVSPLGALWMQSLQMVVVPLVVTQILAALIRPAGAPALGSLGGKTLLVFMTLAVTTSLIIWFLMEMTMPYVAIPQGLVETLQNQAIPQIMEVDGSQTGLSISEWITSLVPRTPLEAAIRGDILQILLFSILIGLAISRLPDQQRNPLSVGTRALADAIMILVSWIMWGMPVGVFSLMLNLTLGSGLTVVGVVGLFFVLVCAGMIIIEVALYPLVALLGRTSMVTFGKAAFPSQIVAATTQSSLASLPALVEGGKDHLDLSEEATGFVLPLCVSMFKVNQAATPLTKMLFLTHILGMHLAPGDVVFFMIGAIALGLATPGIPRGSGGSLKLPLYLAVGIPIEAYLMLEPVKHNPIYDAIATVLNVTGDMVAATLLTRGDRATKPTS